MNSSSYDPEDQQQQITTSMRIMTIIHLALVMGVVMFTGIALAMTYDRLDPTFDPGNVLLIIAMSFTALMILAACLLPLRPSHNTFESPPPMETLRAQVMGRFIVRLALVEGAALLSAVTLLITQSMWTLLPLFAALLILIAFRPTRDLWDARP